MKYSKTNNANLPSEISKKKLYDYVSDKYSIFAYLVVAYCNVLCCKGN